MILPFINYRQKVTRAQLRWILAAGAILVIASSLQQAGLRYTTAANAGFITGFYVVLIPIIQALFLKRRPPAICLALRGWGFCGYLPSKHRRQSHLQQGGYPGTDRRGLLGAARTGDFRSGPRDACSHFLRRAVCRLRGSQPAARHLPGRQPNGKYPFAGLDGALRGYPIGWRSLHAAIRCAKIFPAGGCSHHPLHGGGFCCPIRLFCLSGSS